MLSLDTKKHFAQQNTLTLDKEIITVEYASSATTAVQKKGRGLRRNARIRGIRTFCDLCMLVVDVYISSYYFIF